HLAEIAEPARSRLRVELARIQITAHISGTVLPGARTMGRGSAALRAELNRTIAAAESLRLAVETRAAFRLLAQLEVDDGDPRSSGRPGPIRRARSPTCGAAPPTTPPPPTWR